MPRPQKFSQDQIITATMKVICTHGPSQASIARIARLLKAPTGSIYHRFNSRSELLGKAWLNAAETFQAQFAQHLENRSVNTHTRGLNAVKSIPHWVRKHPDQARILLLYRISDFLFETWPADMKQQAERLDTQLAQGMKQFCRQLFGNTKKDCLRLVSFMLADAPIAALKKHIEKGEIIPPVVDRIVVQTYQSTLRLGQEQ